nr:MAG TPA: hypothetical protein [Caudoviricetes sp.]
MFGITSNLYNVSIHVSYINYSWSIVEVNQLREISISYIYILTRYLLYHINMNRLNSSKV